MKRFLYILCTVTCLFMGCKDDEDREWSPDDKSARTVLVYMAGENNLTLSNGHRYLRSDLNEIIESLKPITEYDLEGVPPTFHPIGGLSNVMREDVERPSFTQAEALVNAPKRQDGSFLIPSILGGGDS